MQANKIAKAKQQANTNQLKKLNRKKAKQLGQAALSKAEARILGENKYLKALVNPEQFDSCFPDEFGGKTAVSRFIYNKLVRVNSDGHYFGVINPTLPDHVIELVTSTAASRSYYGTMNIPGGWTVGTGQVYPAEIIPTLTSVSTNPVSANERVILPSKEVYKLPNDMTGAGSLYVTWLGASIKGYASLDGGAYTEVTNDVAFAIPQATQTVKLGFKATTEPTSVSWFKVGLTLAEATTSAAFHEHGVQNYADLLGEGPVEPLFQEYRTVAMSTLISCESDVTHNGGSITAKCVAGGESAVRLGWLTHPDIAELPDSYEGPLSQGLYSFWVPTDEKDMVFRPVGTNNRDGDLPSLVFSGKAASPAECLLRIRVCLVLEAKCSKPYITTVYSRIAPHEILQACIALQGQKRIMENPLHLEEIKDFLKSVIKKGETVVDFVQTYGPAAAAIGKAAAAFLL